MEEELSQESLELLIEVEVQEDEVMLFEGISDEIRELMDARYVIRLDVNAYVGVSEETGKTEIRGTYRLGLTERGQGYLEGYRAGSLTGRLAGMGTVARFVKRIRLKQD